MDSKIAVAVFVFVVLGVSAQHDHDHSHHEHHRVNVGVYYESLCPDSRKFFNQQLYPSLHGELSMYINLTLVPYGKSTAEFNLNQYEFKCHHGEIECYGNKLHACALHLIDNGNNTEGLGYNKVATGFVNCLMDKSVKNESAEPQYSFPRKDCALLNNVEKLSSIENCANHPDGSNLLANAGKLTDAVQKPLTGVPTIVFNNQYKDADSKMAQQNFVKALCQYIADPKPAECSKNGGLTHHINVAAMVVVLSISRLFL